MKIIHAITGLREAAGTTTFCKRIAEEQAKLGHRVAILLPGQAIPFIPDVVHIHAIWTPWLHKMHRWAHRIGAKVVLSPHGMLAPWAMAHKRWKKILPWHLYQKGDVGKTDLIHVTASLETKWVRDLGFTNPIVEVPLGTDLPNVVAKFDNPIKELLFVGRIYPVKGLDLLIKAWDSVDTTGWKLRLVGPDQAGYMRTLKKMCRSTNVEFTGPLYGEILKKAYAASRALILPSYTENFGAIVLDALSHGLPVLTSEATPWNFLQEKGCGWHFPLEVNALSEKLKVLFATSDDVLREMGARGRKLVEEKYTWPAIAEQMTKAYEGLMKNAAGAEC